MGSNRRKTLATRATAAGDGGGATLGLVARPEAMLTLPANLGRLILAFHNSAKSFSPRGRKAG